MSRPPIRHLPRGRLVHAERIRLLQHRRLQLRRRGRGWKASNPPAGSGTSYIVKRRLPGETEFTFIGVTGKKEFVDATLIAGPDSVQYTVQGQRSDVSGPVSEIFTVNFGRTPEGAMTASVTGGGMHAASPSTVDGRPVQKMVPMGNGGTSRTSSRV